MKSDNQYTLHLLPEPYLKELPYLPKPIVIDNSSYSEYLKSVYSNHIKDLRTYPIIGTFTGKEGDIWEEGRDFRFDVTAPFITGNYSNKCCRCGDIFDGTDKLWFLCKPCCDKKVAIPITQPVEETQEDMWKELIITISDWVNEKECTTVDSILQKLTSNFSITRK